MKRVAFIIIAGILASPAFATDYQKPTNYEDISPETAMDLYQGRPELGRRARKRWEAHARARAEFEMNLAKARREPSAEQFPLEGSSSFTSGWERTEHGWRKRD
jgi:hypothetical protein